MGRPTPENHAPSGVRTRDLLVQNYVVAHALPTTPKGNSEPKLGSGRTLYSQRNQRTVYVHVGLTSDHNIPIIFPRAFKHCFKQNWPLATLFLAFEKIVQNPPLPENLSTSSLLEIPLIYCLDNSNIANYPYKYRPLLVKHAYEFTPYTSTLRRLTVSEFSIEAISPRKLFQLLDTGVIQWSSLMRYRILTTAIDNNQSINLSDYQSTCTLAQVSPSKCTTKIIRSYLLNDKCPTVPEESFKNLWNYFWKCPMPPKARDIWWRGCFKFLPTQKRLNRILPQRFPTVSCKICPSEVEDLDHFIYDCPKKKQIWNECLSFVAQKINISIKPSFTCSDLLKGTVTSYKVPKAKFYALMVGIAIILRNIWLHHWKEVFDNKIFNSRVLINKIMIKFSQIRPTIDSIDINILYDIIDIN